MAPVVLGRQAELEQLTAKLDAVVAGPRAVVVEGPAGIGKTTVWQAALRAARARSFTVLAARAAQTEATLPFAGLIDLFEGVPPARLAGLPAPQRRALEVALLRREPDKTGVDQLAVSLATLQVLRAVAVDAPVVVGIDDLQWLDGATARGCWPSRCGACSMSRSGWSARCAPSTPTGCRWRSSRRSPNHNG
jgi:hypothetical protein